MRALAMQDCMGLPLHMCITRLIDWLVCERELWDERRHDQRG
jgi:hypothetical protein